MLQCLSNIFLKVKLKPRNEKKKRNKNDKINLAGKKTKEESPTNRWLKLIKSVKVLKEAKKLSK